MDFFIRTFYTIIPYCQQFCDLQHSIFKKYINVPSVSYKQNKWGKTRKKICHLVGQRINILIQWYGSADPNPVPKSYGSGTLLKRPTCLNSYEFGWSWKRYARDKMLYVKIVLSELATQNKTGKCDWHYSKKVTICKRKKAFSVMLT